MSQTTPATGAVARQQAIYSAGMSGSRPTVPTGVLTSRLRTTSHAVFVGAVTRTRRPRGIGARP